jgi:hypothetical protein
MRVVEEGNEEDGDRRHFASPLRGMREHVADAIPWMRSILNMSRRT